MMDGYEVKTFPNDEMKSPYSGEEGAYTPWTHEVYCERCRYITSVNFPNPKCGVCKHVLFVVPRAYPTLET